MNIEDAISELRKENEDLKGRIAQLEEVVTNLSNPGEKILIEDEGLGKVPMLADEDYSRFVGDNESLDEFIMSNPGFEGTLEEFTRELHKAIFENDPNIIPFPRD